MATTVEVQTLLRFLSQDAKVPLPEAIGKIKDLQKAALTSPETLSKSDLQAVRAIFTDEKRSKQIISAAKRVSKKRSSSDAPSEPPTKRKKTHPPGGQDSPAAIEASLALPEVTCTEEDLAAITIYSNRAPLVLAFAVTVLRYTLPEQPLSSRLSLAKAVVSANSKTKAKSLGIERGLTADDDGWGQGQPKVRIMGREISVMKRWNYDPTESAIKSDLEAPKEEDNITGQAAAPQSTIHGDSQIPLAQADPQIQTQNLSPPLWGLDLDLLRTSSTPLTPSYHKSSASTLPIHDPKSAKDYLLKSFAFPPSSIPQKRPAKAIEAEKTRNLALLLRALDLLCASWAHALSRQELDRRAWAWYVAVRPDVQDGPAGWGGKGEVRLEKVLGLRRKG